MIKWFTNTGLNTASAPDNTASAPDNTASAPDAASASAQNFTLTELGDKLNTFFKKCINNTGIQECPELIIDLIKHPEYENVLNTSTTSNVEVVKIDGINVTKFRADNNYYNVLKYQGNLYFFKVLEIDDSLSSIRGTTYYSTMNLPRVEIFQDGVFLSKIRKKKDTSEKLDCWQIKVISPEKKSWFGAGRKSNKKRYGSKKNKNKKKNKKSTQRK